MELFILVRLNQPGSRAKDPNHTSLVDTTYGYDADNRPATVTDSGANRTVLSYDNVGNLSNVGLPNSVGVTYQYDTLNRLNAMQTNGTKVSNVAQVFSYAYQVGGGGNRISVVEASGRADTWGYDSTYKLLDETVTGDPNTINGGVTYTYDPVGNRTGRSSTLSPISSQTPVYDLGGSDRMTSDGNNNFLYDLNGSVTQATGSSGVTAYTYDGENRLISVSAPGLTEIYLYDGDGNKVNQTVNGVTTNYLIDTNNLTGYAQVIEEIQGSTIQKVYTYGTTRISQDVFNGVSYVRSYYGYDGQGSVRFLMDSTGNITDQYTYSSFGENLFTSGSTNNSFQYDGEQLDGNTGFYNLRARWMNPGVGRFQTMDSFEGSNNDPISLHKYLFGWDDPINKKDPRGNTAQNLTQAIGTPTWGGVTAMLSNHLYYNYFVDMFNQAKTFLTNVGKKPTDEQIIGICNDFPNMVGRYFRVLHDSDSTYNCYAATVNIRTTQIFNQIYDPNGPHAPLPLASDFDYFYGLYGYKPTPDVSSAQIIIMSNNDGFKHGMKTVTTANGQIICDSKLGISEEILHEREGVDGYGPANYGVESRFYKK